ncbi:MAG: LacI family DNA-binding transcriptional regulator [Oscillospiraceae bacterium]
MSDVNIKLVAKLAGVSISTVSNVLNNARYVSDKTRERVLSVVKTLNYEPNCIAQSMKSNKTRTIGIIIPNIDRIFFSHVITGMQEIADKSGYSLLLYNTGDKFEKETECVRILTRNKVDGIILDSVADSRNVAYFEGLSSLTSGKKHIPVISMERDMTKYGVDSVFVENYKGGMLATQKLIDSGARQIVFITTGSEMVRRRFDGYLEVLKRNGIPFDENLVVEREHSPWSGYNCIHRLLMGGISFDGVFASNDQMAIGALKALDEHNLRVPEDVCVIGFDNIFASSIVSPSLTAINVPKYRLGKQTFELLLKNIEKNTKNDSAAAIELPVTLVERESTWPKRKMPWELEDW